MSKIIPLTQGKFAIVDDADYEWLNQWKWYAWQHGRTYYARRGRRLMHQLIIGVSPGLETHHVNGDGLDNRRANLQHCTHTENCWNSRKEPNCSSRYKGVDWNQSHGKWRARIRRNGKREHLGYFDYELEAALAYASRAKHFSVSL